MDKDHHRTSSAAQMDVSAPERQLTGSFVSNPQISFPTPQSSTVIVDYRQHSFLSTTFLFYLLDHYPNFQPTLSQ
jgi:hypothetical protein